MSAKLLGKVVLITGASSGLGEEIAYESAKKQATLVLCARNINKLQRVADVCHSLSKQPVYVISLDISNYDSVMKAIAVVKEEVCQVDILVNNAGVGLFTNFLDMSYEDMKKMMSVNVLGLMTLTQHIALMMAKVGSGHIINIASQAGKMATPKSSVYSASKFAVIGFSNALRLEVKPLGIKVTTINPGPIKTNFFETADPTGNYLENIGKMAIEPAYLARKIVSIYGKSKREINTPFIMEMGSIGYHLFPKLGDYLAGSLFNKK